MIQILGLSQIDINQTLDHTKLFTNVSQGNSMRSFYKMHTCCKIYNGINRAIIIDEQRNSYFLVPSDFYYLFKDGNEIDWETIKKKYTDKIKIINEYIDFLISNDLIFNCTNIGNCFPEVSTQFNISSNITNAIVDIDSENIEILKKTLEQLVNLQCFTLEINLIGNTSLDKIYDLLRICKLYEIDCLFLNIDKIKTRINFIKLKNEFPFLFSVTIYNAEKHYEDLLIEENTLKVTYKLHELTQSYNLCGKIGEEYFTLKNLHIFESLVHNTCLNRKIAIDAEGNIKNCPSMKESFGNIKDTTLEEAINKPGFKKYWNIKKDDITKCKDCEFRHVCTDCRAYIENPEDIYSAPLKCGYDPYTCEWEEWSTNPLKQKAIDYYGMREIIMKNE